MLTNENDSFYSLADTFQQSNAAGMISKLRLIPITSVQRILKSDIGEVVLPPNAIQFKRSEVIIDIEAAHNSIMLTETMGVSEHGRSYLAQIIAELPKNRIALTKWFHQNINREFLAVTKDRQGNVKLVGTMEQPLVFSGFISSTDKRAGKNMAAIELSANVQELAKYIDGTDDIFDVIAIPNIDNVLLSAIKSGQLALAFIDVSLSVYAENQTEFIIPDTLIDKPIVSFSINHIPYSLGIEYTISMVNGIKTIRWLAVDFPIAETDLVQIKYLEILNIL